MVYENSSKWEIEKYIFLNCKIIRYHRYQQLKSKDNQEII